MKVVILAAGYGTRLERDLEKDGRFKELHGVPKPLLPVAGRPVISHWLDILLSCAETRGEEVYVVVNEANRAAFEEWSVDHPQVQLVSDGTRTNEARLGAVACVELAVRHFNIQDHLIVIGGDTLFYEDFDLSLFLHAFLSSSALTGGGGFVPCYTCLEEDTSKRGILELDGAGKVLNFLEKPQAHETTSRKASPCFYIYSKDAIPLLNTFLKEKKEAPLKERDAPGNFIKYLYKKRPVFAAEISGRYDIGGLDSYLQCCKEFKPPTNGGAYVTS